jgi:CheY-like chemotaxis protein
MIHRTDILQATHPDRRRPGANVLLLTRLLADAGYTQVQRDAQPAEVCALHREQDFDLILLDLQMPGWTASR